MQFMAHATPDQAALFHHPQGPRYHGLALGYALAAYLLGWLGLFSDTLVINLLCVLLLGHGMTIAAYLIHECGHNTVFRDNRPQCPAGYFPDLDLWRLLRHLQGYTLQTFPPSRG